MTNASPVPDHTGHHVAAVPATGCQRDDLFQVDMLGQQVGNLLLGVSLIFEIAVFVVVLAVEEMSDAFEDRHGVGRRRRVLSQFDQAPEQLVDVRQVEIAGQYQTARHPVVLARDGMHVLDVVLAERAVAQMAEEHLAGESDMALEPLRVAEPLGVFRRRLRDPRLDALENVFDRRGGVRALAVDVDASGLGIELDVGQSGSVLSPVVLLFHQQVHFVQPVKGRAVFFQIEIDGFQQADHGDAALVFDRIAHNSICKVPVRIRKGFPIGRSACQRYLFLIGRAIFWGETGPCGSRRFSRDSSGLWPDRIL